MRKYIRLVTVTALSALLAGCLLGPDGGYDDRRGYSYFESQQGYGWQGDRWQGDSWQGDSWRRNNNWRGNNWRDDRRDQGHRGDRSDRGDQGGRVDRGDRGDRGNRGNLIDRGNRGGRMEQSNRTPPGNPHGTNPFSRGTGNLWNADQSGN